MIWGEKNSLQKFIPGDQNDYLHYELHLNDYDTRKANYMSSWLLLSKTYIY